MTKREGKPAKLIVAAPAIAVAEVAEAAAWFEARLGFRAQGTFGEPPVWASLQRDGVEIMLTLGTAPSVAGTLAAYVYVDDADALYAELTGRGADLAGPPVDRAYRCREVEARMPDGRSIVFGADLSR